MKTKNSGMERRILIRQNSGSNLLSPKKKGVIKNGRLLTIKKPLKKLFSMVKDNFLNKAYIYSKLNELRIKKYPGTVAFLTKAALSYFFKVDDSFLKHIDAGAETVTAYDQGDALEKFWQQGNGINR